MQLQFPLQLPRNKTAAGNLGKTICYQLKSWESRISNEASVLSFVFFACWGQWWSGGQGCHWWDTLFHLIVCTPSTWWINVGFYWLSGIWPCPVSFPFHSWGALIGRLKRTGHRIFHLVLWLVSDSTQNPVYPPQYKKQQHMHISKITAQFKGISWKSGYELSGTTLRIRSRSSITSVNLRNSQRMFWSEKSHVILPCFRISPTLYFLWKRKEHCF